MVRVVAPATRAVTRYRQAEERLREASAERDAAMLAARAEGMTLDALAQTLGVTRQRVMMMLREQRVRGA